MARAWQFLDHAAVREKLVRGRMVVTLGGMLATLAGPAIADGRVAAAYAFSWAGIDVAELETEVVELGGTYNVVWSGRTVGMLGLLFPFEASGRASGSLAAGDYVARQYASSSQWRDGGGTWRVSFAPDTGAAAVEGPPLDTEEREPVPPALRTRPDPASLALAAIKAARPGLAMTATSFDGKRAVRFALTCENGMPPADGMLCRIAGELVAGASRRWRDDGKAAAPREPVRVWLAGAGAAEPLWPVRLEAASSYGMVTGRLLRLVHEPAAAG